MYYDHVENISYLFHEVNVQIATAKLENKSKVMEKTKLNFIVISLYFRQMAEYPLYNCI